MANIHFAVGSIGSGNTEIFGYFAQKNRNLPRPLEFDLPAKRGAGIAFIWAGLNNAIDGVQEAKYAFEHNVDFDSVTTLNLVRAAINSNTDASDIYIGGCGVTLFIDQLIQEYPDCVVYFTKREIPGFELEAIKFRANLAGYSLGDDFTAYLESLNARLLQATNAKVEALGYEWTAGNSKVLSQTDAVLDAPEVPNTSLNDTEDNIHKTVIFMSPTLVAVYKPTFTINFF